MVQNRAIADLLKLNEEITVKLQRLGRNGESRRLDFQEDLINCPVCWTPYSRVARVPLVGSCGHTICGRCVQMLPNSICSTCRTGNFHQRTKNYIFYELLENNDLIEETNIDVNNTILILGGSSQEFRREGERVGLVLSADRSKWIEMTFKVPFWEDAGGAVYLNDEIYIFGGSQGKVLYKFDKNLKWIRLADMNVARSGIKNSSLVWDGYIWVIGGMEANVKYDHETRHTYMERIYHKTVERYDPRRNKWTLMPEMKHPRAIAAAAVINNGITITGGASKEGVTDTVERFENGCWNDLPGLPFRQYSHGIISYKGEMLPVAYGPNGHFNSMQTNPPTTTQRDPDETCIVIALDNEVYAIGGSQPGEKPSKKVSIFDGKNWRAGPDLPYVISAKSAVVIPKHLANCLCAYHM